MQNNIKHIGEYANNAKMISPEQCLRNCLETEVGKRGPWKNAKKAIVICLDDTEGQYDLAFSQAGMKASEIVALLETAKFNFLNMR